MGKLKDKIFVDGYNPFNIFNIILSVVSGLIFAMFVLGLSDGHTMKEMLGNSKDLRYLLVAIVCFLLLLFRNRKLKSIPKMIIFSVISSALGVLVAIVGFALFILFALLSGGDTSKFKAAASKIANSTSTGGQQWTEQYSQTKGTYYTDGQGNFKDQYGNDVYNPQGVTDYDQL